MCLVTIGLPVYNSEVHLKDCIDSILNQKFKDFKLIIINDGSRDNSVSIISKYNDPRIVFIDDSNNKGLSYRLNQIIRMADTKYLVRMDADDIMHPQRLEIQFAILENDPNIDLLGSNAYTINGKNKIMGLRFHASSEIIRTTSFIHPSIMGKLSFFKDNSYDNFLFRIEDVDLWYRTRFKYIFCCISLPLIYYREEPKNYYKKYIISKTTIIQVFKKYKFNRFWIIFLIKQYLRAFLYFFFNLFGKEAILINKRNKYMLSNKSIKEIEIEYHI
jgi:glycosyltransferase involved in cell wall biosynthesis